MNSQAKEILSILKVCGYRDSELTANLLNVVDKEASTEYLNDLDEFFTNVSKHEGIAHELRVIPKIADFVEKKYNENWDKMGNTGDENYCTPKMNWNEENYYFGYFRAMEDIKSILEK